MGSPTGVKRPAGRRLRRGRSTARERPRGAHVDREPPKAGDECPALGYPGLQPDLQPGGGVVPTIGWVRRTATALALLASAGITVLAPPAGAAPPRPRADRQVVLVLDRGSVRRHLEASDPALALAPVPAAAGPRVAFVRSAPLHRRPRATFATALDHLLTAGMIDQPTHDRDRTTLLDARRSLGRIVGTRHDELGAVLANLDAIAAAGMITPSRLPGLVLTLARNRQWWTTGPLLGDGQRVGFAGSQLVWQYYAGQGIEIQWLGTFGKANGYFLGGRAHDADLTALLDEALGLATQRAGGIAWEYDFRFDGGAPPWVSGLAQGTALQALGRAAVRFARADYFNAAHGALGVFSTPPPEGVRVATPAGAHYLIYSFAPGERVLNAFVQSLVGLYDYSGLANSDAARALFTAGEAEARLEVPRYDTGAWSLYDQSTESDLSYHTLLRDFLSHLCDRLRAPAAPASAAPTGSAAAGPTGGTLPAPTPAGATADPSPVAPPDAYCTAADHFTAYLHQPPVIAVTAAGPDRVGRAVRLRLALSKVSLVRLTATRSGHTVYRMSQEIGHGTRTLVWRPTQPGSYRLTATAIDLAGNAGAAATTASVAPPARHR